MQAINGLLPSCVMKKPGINRVPAALIAGCGWMDQSRLKL
jgi:hypothetical protein